ncbi:hypothetical protein SAMN05216404_10986 [Nitrosospira multiformis]|uniref:Uncharacterized protein n=1 Tax=Nitrosospira multiformis TaxID=1231 RepID=A0A1H8KWG9_9PROT|nr:hypothetical protein [Nitrosospira multiformis]SEN97215.1 hypothetical protein SAMN05216404_10986 [Nitrosospira multiformis]
MGLFTVAHGHLLTLPQPDIKVGEVWVIRITQLPAPHLPAGYAPCPLAGEAGLPLAMTRVVKSLTRTVDTPSATLTVHVLYSPSINWNAGFLLLVG